MPNIEDIKAIEILDSRGNPTLLVIVSSDGQNESFRVPSGASTGLLEAHELRDEGMKVDSAIKNVNTVIRDALLGKDVSNQREIDNILIKLDGTQNKDKLGGNAMIGVSIACAKVAAKVSGIEVYEYLRTLAEMRPSRTSPYLFINLLEGGKHANNGLAFQEYHIVPDTNDTEEAVNASIKVQSELKKVLEKELGQKDAVMGDEGGYAPETKEVRKPLTLLKEAVQNAHLDIGIKFSLDVAASSFYENGTYKVDGDNITTEQMLALYTELIDEFDIFSIEDPLEERDFENFAKLKEENDGLLVVGDDITVTNVGQLKKAIEKESINAMIIKPNQIGTLSETLDTMSLARENNIELIVSHRSGETDDDFIADLAFAFSCFGLKAGSPEKPERMVKYKRLINILSQRRISPGLKKI